MLDNEIIGRRETSTDDIRPVRDTRSVFDQIVVASEAATACRDLDLRGFCCRLFGWTDKQSKLADEVMNALLAAVARGAAIALRGQSDLVPIAHALHRRIFGPDRPFVVCDPRRQEDDGSVRAPPNRKTGMLALAAASGGSVCVRSNRLPDDFALLAAAVRGSVGLAQVFVCLNNDDRVRDMLCPPIEIPPLSQRTSDLDRLINEYLADATLRLGVCRMQLSGPVSDSILYGVNSLVDLEKAVLRLVALKTAPNLTRAAKQLGMASVSLSRWASRRGIMAALGDLEYCEQGDVVGG